MSVAAPAAHADALKAGPRFFSLGGVGGLSATVSQHVPAKSAPTARFIPLSGYAPLTTPAAPMQLASIDRAATSMPRATPPIFALPRPILGAPPAPASSHPLRQFMDKAEGWVWPVPGEERITSGFGKRADPVHGHTAMHEGLDIAAPYGSRVVAAAAGVVEETGTKGRLGSFVKIRHGNDTSTIYGHLSSVTTKAGEHVQAGDLIGKIGMSGRTTGPHLHFAVREDGELVDPSKKVKAPTALASVKMMEVSSLSR